MFGETYFKRPDEEKTVDKKDRIIIPSYTGVEAGEYLCLIDINDKLCIYGMNYLENMVGINEIKNINDLEKQNDFFEELSEKVVEIRRVDKQNRINISKETQKQYELSENITLESHLNYLKISNSQKVRK